MDNFETFKYKLSNQKLPVNFLKELKIIYDIILKCIPENNANNEENNDNILFPNSFIFRDKVGNYKIENSIAFLINEIELKDPLSKHIKNMFLKYYNNTPDYSNYFYLLLYEFLVKVYNNIINTYITLNLFHNKTVL